MLGLHTDGVHIIGITPEIKRLLKEFKIPIARNVTGNTLVFALNAPEVLERRRTAIAFATHEAPYFFCVIGTTVEVPEIFEVPQLSFARESDFVSFVRCIFYAAQGYLHLDFELCDLRNHLTQNKTPLQAYTEEQFGDISSASFVFCFCFTKGGFLESDALFQKLTSDGMLPMENLRMGGTFHSSYDFICCFA
ncbi:MAG: hypothetical protein R3Y53_11505 [Bacillota bacterium]